MMQQSPKINSHATLAPLRNVSSCLIAMESVVNRPSHLSGMIAFYGPAGYGKTTAAIFVANEFRAYHVEVKSTWTQKAFLLNICREMGIQKPAKVIYELAEQVSEQLASSGRPLIIDEFDHVIKKGYVELVRDLSDGTGAPILLIGEEQIDANLQRWERFHRRILDWIPAQPADMSDAECLRDLYCKSVQIADDLLTKVVDVSNGSISRIVSNLDRIQRNTLTQGNNTVNAEQWGNQRLDNGRSPSRRG